MSSGSSGAVLPLLHGFHDPGHNLSRFTVLPALGRLRQTIYAELLSICVFRLGDPVCIGDQHIARADYHRLFFVTNHGKRPHHGAGDIEQVRLAAVQEQRLQVPRIRIAFSIRVCSSYKPKKNVAYFSGEVFA